MKLKDGFNLFVGTKLVGATPLTLGEYNDMRDWPIPASEDPDAEGFLIEYLGNGNPNHPDFDNYISWCPKEQFEKANVLVPQFQSFEPHQVRVVAEQAGLTDKIQKLKAFIGTTVFNGLPANEKSLLEFQLRGMQTYAEALEARINLWAGKVPQPEPEAELDDDSEE